MSAKVFLSYRRQDSAGHTGRIFDRLGAAFGAEAVFHDVDSIRAGQDFVRTIEETIRNCSVVLVMIGPGWPRIEDARGRRRLEDPNDYVRLEVASALRRGIPVIPVLVGGAQMPDPQDLPEELQRLTRCNAIEVRHSHFEGDVRKLVGALEECTGLKARSPSMHAAVARQIRESPVLVGQIGVCAAAGVMSYYWPPPADLTAEGSRAAGPVAAIVLLAAAVILALLRMKPDPDRPRRLTVMALACLACGIGALSAYQWLWSTFTAPYESTPVVVGSEATAIARQYLAAHREMTLEQLIMDAGGEVERLWTRDSIRWNVLLLRAAHVVMMLSFAACVLAVIQVMRLKR